MPSQQNSRTRQAGLSLWIIWIGIGCLTLAGLLLVSYYNLLQFHGMAELFSIAVAWAIVMLVWNTRRFIDNDALIFIGIAYFFIGFVDLLHTLAFKGMGVFDARWGANLATQLWISARYLEASALILFPLLFGRRVQPLLYFGAWAVVTSVLLALIFYWQIFPVCYIENVGLTPFKVHSEYFICFMLVIALILLHWKRGELESTVYRLLAAAIVITVCAELTFTFYVRLNDPSFLVGHFLKIFSFILIYLALIRSGLTQPYAVLFRSLSESEERFRLLFANVPDAIFLETVDDRILDANAAASRLLGYSREEFQTMTVSGLLAPEASEMEGCLLQDDVAGRGFRKGLYMRNDGTRVPVEVNVSQMRIKDQDYVLTVVRDITERVRIEEALRQSEQQYRELVQSANNAIVRWKRDGSIVFMNQFALDFFGYRAHDVIGKSFGILMPERDSTGKDLTGLVEDIAANPERYANSIKENICRDGGRVWMTWTNKPIKDRSGQVLELLSIGSDITELRTAQEELIHAREAAEAANQAKSLFLANMSHEIRTPMNGILGMTDLALTKNTNPQVKEYLGYVKESGLHLLDIINDILDLSRIEAGNVKLLRDRFSLKEFLRMTLEPFQSVFLKKNIDFILKVDSAVPDWVIGDPGRLRQVLVNLVGNAVKFTEQGHVTVSAGVDETFAGEEGIRLLFSVRDTGIGIPADHINTIFDSFEQVHTSLHAKYEGTGLGLSISKNLVELMGGDIRVESREGVGSTFVFSIVMESAPEEQTTVKETTPSAWTGRPLNILVAEDNRLNQIFIKAVLSKEGHKVAFAQNGRQTLEQLAQGDFDLILMDIRMPEMDGDETMRVIRQNPPAGVKPDIPVIALTAYALQTDRERFMKSGFNAYLTKPVQINELYEVLAKLS